MDPEPQEKELPRVTEEAILDSLFYACDTNGTGFVAVSKLIDYLRSAIASDTDNNNIEFVDNLDDLSLILDRDGQDVHINISTYQAGISEWIEDIRKRSLASIDDDFLSSVSINCASPTFQPISDDSRRHITSTPNISSNSVEGLGGESPLKNDSERAAEMTSIIETLQLNNKRLMEQHAVIQVQMEQTEETNMQLHNEVQELKKQIQSFQALTSKCKELEAENMELRQSVAESKEISTNLWNANTIMLKEKKNLESSIEQLQSKLISTQHHLDALQDERRALSESLTIQKQVNMRLEEIRDAKEDLVQESSSKTEYLSSVIHELTLANEDLKTEKNKLGEAFSDLNGELARLRKQHSPNLPPHLQTPHKTSTPTRKLFSLKQELEEQLTSDSKGLPSPLIGFRNDSLNTSDTSNVSALDQSWISSLSCDSNNSSLESFGIIASQVANEFKDKKERALRQIEELDKLEKTPEIRQKQLHLKNQFDKDMDVFAEKVNILSLKKKNAEKRSAKLLVAMKQLKEESKQLQDDRDKAYQKLGNLSLNTDQLDTRVTGLQNELANERMKSKDMEGKLKSLEHQLITANNELTRIRTVKDSLETSLHTQTEGKESLERLLEEVNRSHSHLDVQQTHQILRIKELENELARAMSIVAVEKERVTALEESLQLSVNRNNNEMQEILDMIPLTDAQITNKSKSSPKSSSPRITGHVLRLRLKEFISKVDFEALGYNAVRVPPDGTQNAVRVPPDGTQITQTDVVMLVGRPPSPPFSSVSSQSPNRSLQSPIPIRETRTTGSQTDLSGSPEEPKLISLWRRKLSPGVHPLDDESYLGVDGIDASINSSHFVDGVGLHVSPPPNEKEIEKQFKTLVLAFQTDQLTLNKRLEVQTRSREIAERNMDRELENLFTQMKELEEKYMKTRELKQVALSMKSQVDVLRRSAQRLGIVSQQHGSVQQECRMWSGVEVMICHAENLNRKVEIMKLDLNEFSNKGHLHSDDSDCADSRPQGALNGPTRLVGRVEEIRTVPDQNTSGDNTSSLVNFVMAIHNTSQRAKQVLTNFRRRTIDASTFYSSPGNSRSESVDEGSEEEQGDRDSEVSGASGNVTDEDDVYISQDNQEVYQPSLCRRVCTACFRLTLSVLLIIVLSITIIVFLNHNTSYKLQRVHIPKPILDILDPIATLVHDRRPPS